MKKVLLIVDNFTPDLGAASFRFEGVVKKLVKKNIYVKVLCSYPNRIDIKEIKELNLENFEILRINNNFKLKTGIISRSIVYFRFLLNSLKEGIKLSKDVDLIIASSPQLFVGVSGAIISIVKRKKFVLDIRDLWPDIVIDMKIMSKFNPIYIGLKVLEKFMYKASDLIIYNSPGFKEYLEKQNKEMKLITNGLDNYVFSYFKDKDIKIENKKKYKMMYAGNLGIAQDIIILIDFAIKYKNEIDIILIGEGSQEELIKQKVFKNGIKNIKIIKSMPRIKLLEKYLEADILFLQLKNIKMFKKTIPSKIFEYMSTKKPIIYGLEGIGRKIIQDEFEQKYYFESNNLESLCDTYEILKKDIKENNIREINLKKLEQKYLRENLSEEYATIIEKLK